MKYLKIKVDNEPPENMSELKYLVMTIGNQNYTKKEI
jgi:hypothetical protein